MALSMHMMGKSRDAAYIPRGMLQQDANVWCVAAN